MACPGEKLPFAFCNLWEPCGYRLYRENWDGSGLCTCTTHGCVDLSSAHFLQTCVVVCSNLVLNVGVSLILRYNDLLYSASHRILLCTKHCNQVDCTHVSCLGVPGFSYWSSDWFSDLRFYFGFHPALSAVRNGTSNNFMPPLPCVTFNSLFTKLPAILCTLFLSN